MKKRKKSNFHIGLHSDIYEPISFKFTLMMDTTKLYIIMLMPVLMTLILIQGHIYVR